jgi:dolichyl-phosphate-mannose--protein O-mannosyl transferase
MWIALVILGVLLLLDVVALWCGVDSRDGRDWQRLS